MLLILLLLICFSIEIFFCILHALGILPMKKFIKLKPHQMEN